MCFCVRVCLGGSGAGIGSCVEEMGLDLISSEGERVSLGPDLYAVCSVVSELAG